MTAMSKPVEPESLDSTIKTIQQTLRDKKRVNIAVPSGGRLYIDRQLPFLCVYRSAGKVEDVFDSQLITTQAAFFITPKLEDGKEDPARAVCQSIIEVLTPVFGRFLLLEVWLRYADSGSDDSEESDAGITVNVHPGHAEEKVVAEMLKAMKDVMHGLETLPVRLAVGSKVRTPGFPSLLNKLAREQLNVLAIGLQCTPIYRNPATSEFFPAAHRLFRRQLADALQRSFYAFLPPSNLEPNYGYEALAPTLLRRQAGGVDQKLEAVASQFDFLLYVTPVNALDAWEQFSAGGFEREPTFSYRPLPFETRHIKRALYEVRLEEVEDPILWQIFAEKQDELDSQISLLRDRGTPAFRHGSVRLYGSADGELVALARTILSHDQLRSPCASKEPPLNAEQVSVRASEEIARYRAINPKFDAQVEITSKIAAGMMTSRNRLLVSSTVQFPAHRVEALLHHEIGTHLLTWFNGRAQPLGLMHYGLAGYEALQEGLAVLAEYLCGGLDPHRLRTLAARVEAVHCLEQGATFVETFRRLHHDHGFSAQGSYRITTRVFRGGGLTKDAVYLRGLSEVFQHLSASDSIEPLLVGKIALRHVPALHVLSQRHIIKPAALLPRYLDEANRRWLKDQTRFTFARLLQDLSYSA